MLRSCLDPPFHDASELSQRLQCPDRSAAAHSGKAHPRLCAGLLTILSANCSSLNSLPYLTGVIEQIGLVNDARGVRLYGTQSVHRIAGASTRAGLWQEPQQIAGAMIAVGRKLSPVRRYVEVGVYTAWTTTVMATYLQRVSGGESFEGRAVDITSAHITPGTMHVLGALNVSFVSRGAFERRLRSEDGASTAPAAPLSSRFDLCFIDGDHSYRGVRSDYQLMGPRCRGAMFHDIRDTCAARRELTPRQTHEHTHAYSAHHRPRAHQHTGARPHHAHCESNRDAGEFCMILPAWARATHAPS